VDLLRRDDLRLAKETPTGEKLRQALELMELGLSMQRRKLRAADPDAREEVIEERLLAWMSAPR
jgi:hypothetical protein